MATTSLWRIKGKVKSAIEYIENPEKVIKPRSDSEGEEASIETVMDYVSRDSATDRSQLVTAINCNLLTASEEMKETKQRFGKPGGTVAYHGYQSFREGEVT